MADDYDDPAYSGGNMERPAIKRLMIVLPDEMQVKLHANGIENLALDVARTANRKSTTNTEEALA